MRVTADFHAYDRIFMRMTEDFHACDQPDPSQMEGIFCKLDVTCFLTVSKSFVDRKSPGLLHTMHGLGR